MSDEKIEVTHYEYPSKIIPLSELPKFELFGWESKLPKPAENTVQKVKKVQ